VTADGEFGFLGVHWGAFRGVKSQGPHMECGPAFCLFNLYIQYTKWGITHLHPILKSQAVVRMRDREFSTGLGG
jgi:hypothetical protein